MFELGLERGAGSHIDPVSGSHGQPEKGVFLPHQHEPWAHSRGLETPLAEIGETHEKNCHTDVSLGLLLGIPACSDSNSPNTTGQSQPTTTGQQAPSTMGQQTPSAEPTASDDDRTRTSGRHRRGGARGIDTGLRKDRRHQRHV